MRPIYSDPDFTGYPQPEGSPPAWWILTADQWYVIARIVYREYIRTHAFQDPGKRDPDDVELNTINYRVRGVLSEMFNSPTWSRISWGQKIPWNYVACYANRRSEDPDNFFGKNYDMCSAAVYSDYSYYSGLAAMNSSLDPVEPYADPVNVWRYEQACDSIYSQVFSSHGITQDQQVTHEDVQGGGSAWQQTIVAESSSKPYNWFVGPVSALVAGGVLYGLAALLGGGTATKVVSGGVGAVAGAVLGGRV